MRSIGRNRGVWVAAGCSAAVIVGAAGCAPTGGEPPPAPAVQLPEPHPEEIVLERSSLTAGFEDVAVVTGRTQPTAVKFAPDGKMFVAQKNGQIYVYDGVDDTSATLFADLSAEVYDFWDRGLLGLAIDPAYPAMPFVYVLYTLDAESLGGTIPRWNDDCPSPPGPTAAGCVAYGRVARLEDKGSATATAASETILVEGFGQQYPSHSIGTLAFGPDGALYVSAGEGASFNFTDWGQDGAPSNPLADPPGSRGSGLSPPSARGGALRSQSLRRPAGEPVLLNGAILRIDKLTGAAPPDNPLASHADANARRIVAYGLRNPFRFTIHPSTGDLWIGDVGWDTWEEINRVVPVDGTVENLGWPCYEGANRQNGYDSANLTLCEDLYATTLHVAPHYAYNHASNVVAGEGCGVGSSSISGLAIYNGGAYPSDYQGALFFADYSRNCIWVMRATNGVPDKTRIATFVTAAPTPVDLQIGPGGDLFYVDEKGGAVRRVRYRAPHAVASATPAMGPAPLAVTFDGTGSTPGNAGDTLTFSWDLDGDGVFGDATSAVATRTYAAERTVSARLRVTDARGAAAVSAPVTITVGAGAPPPPPSNPPAPVIAAPSAGTTWIVGTTLTFSGSATDPEDGPLPASALSWDLVMMHCPSDCHEHLLQRFVGVTGGSFVAPDHEYPSHLELRLTATDSGGKKTTVALPLEPRTVDLTFNATPLTSPALQLGVGPKQLATPFTRTVIIGSTNSVSAPDQVVGATAYSFSSWSDGGGAAHNLVAPATATTYTATFAGKPWSIRSLYLEAESATLTAPMQSLADGTASGGRCITVAPGNVSMSAVPTNGRATWSFNLSDTGRYRFWGSVINPTDANDSFWVRIDGGAWIKWNDQAPLGTTWHWVRIWDSGAGGAPVEVDLAAGAHTLELAYREDGAKLDQLFIVDSATATPALAVPPSPPPPPPPPPLPPPSTSLYIEAESATLTAPMQSLVDAAASGGGYITVAAGNASMAAAPTNGHATWSFSVSAAGRYRFWGRVVNPTDANDSFWVRVDGGAWIKWNDQAPLSSSWHWVRVWDSGAGGAPVELDLAAGAHTLELAYREDGTRLDRLFIASSATATP